VRLCVYEEVNCLSERMCKCGIVWDVGGDQLCFLCKQSSEISISKIHEATRYSASLKLVVEIVAEKFRV
jgi:hypothetical protein